MQLTLFDISTEQEEKITSLILSKEFHDLGVQLAETQDYCRIAYALNQIEYHWNFIDTEDWLVDGYNNAYSKWYVLFSFTIGYTTIEIGEYDNAEFWMIISESSEVIYNVLHSWDEQDWHSCCIDIKNKAKQLITDNWFIFKDLFS